MRNQPTRRAQPADPTAVRLPLSLLRAGRFCLLVLFSAAMFDLNIPLVGSAG